MCEKNLKFKASSHSRLHGGKKTARMNVREEMHQEIPSRAQSVTINARKDESYLKKYSHLWTDGKIEFMKQCLLHGRFLGAEAPELHAGCLGTHNLLDSAF
ncbi:uncharacterized protein LOC102555817 isoform X4 [Rattus norvegicus]|uniref:uncharacterized protein LOC102555817 isoform X4 n=1 Tax=Rattus norvegicus TaxID=10116 RepID=UPI002FD85366